MRYDRLVAPVVSLLVVLALLIGARTYDGWSVKAPSCSLRAFTGIPCIACGGTRAMKALGSGEIAKATQFNPLVALGVFAVVFWFIWTVATMKASRFQRGEASDAASHSVRKSASRWGIVAGLLVLLNWIYLICYLPS